MQPVRKGLVGRVVQLGEVGITVITSNLSESNLSESNLTESNLSESNLSEKI